MYLSSISITHSPNNLLHILHIHLPLTILLEQYVVVGQAVYIEGQLRTRSWEAPDGTKRHKTEVVIKRFKGNLQKDEEKCLKELESLQSPDEIKYRKQLNMVAAVKFGVRNTTT